MMLKFLKIAGTASLLTSGIWLSSCDGTESVTPDGDYFPTSRSTEKYFVRETYSGGDQNEPTLSDTVRVKITGDTLINGIAYEVQTVFAKYWTIGPTRIEIPERTDVVRRDHKKCYYVPDFAPGREFRFLDWSLPGGASWEYVDGFEDEFKFEFRAVPVRGGMTINDAHFNNVIEVEQRDLYRSSSSKEYQLRSIHRRWFATGVGEIRSEQQIILPRGWATRMSLLQVK
jgi:hypothetical protein